MTHRRHTHTWPSSIHRPSSSFLLTSHFLLFSLDIFYPSSDKVQLWSREGEEKIPTFDLSEKYGRKEEEKSLEIRHFFPPVLRKRFRSMSLNECIYICCQFKPMALARWCQNVSQGRTKISQKYVYLLKRMMKKMLKFAVIFSVVEIIYWIWVKWATWPVGGWYPAHSIFGKRPALRKRVMPGDSWAMGPA